MVLRVYPYLDEVRIAIDAPINVLKVVEGNIEERALEEERYGGVVRIQEGDLRVIQKDKTAKYLSIRKNSERGVEGYDYLRYRTHVQTIWKINDFEYVVKEYLANNESGALKCFKKIYYALPEGKNKVLVHAAAVDLAQKGILIVGKKRSGKTTLAFNMVDKMGAALVEGGNTLVSFGSQLKAYYLPRPIYARFATIADSPYLSVLLEDIDGAEAHQPWDIESIKEVIRTKAFSVDGGLNFSRRVFRNLSGKNTLPCSKVKMILFPSYSEGNEIRIKEISPEEAYKKLLEREFKLDLGLGKVQDQNDIESPQNSLIQPEWLTGLTLKTISFDGNKDLNNAVLEELVA